MITASPQDGQPPAGSKAVPSAGPGPGPQDASANLQRHRDRPDAGPTVPAGGYPQTVGNNPDAPAHRQASDSTGTPADSGEAPGVRSQRLGGGLTAGGYG